MPEEIKHSEKSYELLAVFAGGLKSSEFKKELEKWEIEISKIGKILNKTVWENRPLAYKIKQEESGTYFITHFEAEGSKIAELENNLRLDTKVIRHLIYKTPKNYEWREYSEEELEHDFKKLKSAAEEDKPAPARARRSENRMIKKSPVPPAIPKKEAEDLKKPKIEKAKAVKPESKKADAGEMNQKLDDILADL